MEFSESASSEASIKRKIFIILYFLAGATYPVVGGVLLNNFYFFDDTLSLEFRRPWFLAWGMFLGCTFLIIPLYFSKKSRNSPVINWALFRDTAVPSICLIFASALTIYGLIYLPAPLWQCIRSFSVIFTVLVNDSQSKGKSILIDWTSMFIILVGVIVAGMGVMARQNYILTTGSRAFYATLCVIASEGIYSGGTRLYEAIFQKWEDTGALEIVTYQGGWGLFLCSLVVLPLLSISAPSSGVLIYENSLESFRHLFSSSSLFFTFFGFIISYVVFMFSSIETTDSYGAVRLQMFSSFLPVVLWPICVLSHYLSTASSVGEPVDWNTIPELIGFGIIILGTLVFIRTIRIPWFSYEEPENDKELSDIDVEK